MPLDRPRPFVAFEHGVPEYGIVARYVSTVVPLTGGGYRTVPCQSALVASVEAHCAAHGVRPSRIGSSPTQVVVPLPEAICISPATGADGLHTVALSLGPVPPPASAAPLTRVDHDGTLPALAAAVPSSTLSAGPAPSPPEVPSHVRTAIDQILAEYEDFKPQIARRLGHVLSSTPHKAAKARRWIKRMALPRLLGYEARLRHLDPSAPGSSLTPEERGIAALCARYRHDVIHPDYSLLETLDYWLRAVRDPNATQRRLRRLQEHFLPHSCELSDLAHRAVTPYLAEAEANQVQYFQQLDGLRVATAEQARRVLSVFRNLAQNGFRHAAPRQDQRFAKIACDHARGVFVYTDNGRGMPEDLVAAYAQITAPLGEHPTLAHHVHHNGIGLGALNQALQELGWTIERVESRQYVDDSTPSGTRIEIRYKPEDVIRTNGS